MIPPLKQITGWPGYFVSQDGQVYSTRNNQERNMIPVKVNRYGKVALSNMGYHKQLKPQELATKAWQPRWFDKNEGVNSNVK